VQEKFEDLAQALAAAWRTGTTIALPAADAAPRSRAEAFAIQDRITEILGDRCAGWKVGAAVRAVQIMEGHDGPIVGRLLASRVYSSPARVSAALYAGYGIECEFAFRFETAVPPRAEPYTRAELEAQIMLYPGLEIAGSRYAKNPGDRKATTYDAIADSGTGGGYIIAGGIADWHDLDLDLATLPIIARIDGGEPLHTYTGDYRGDPVDIVVETVNGFSGRGIGLAPGAILSTGSLTLPAPLLPGQTLVAQFGDLIELSVSMEH
jgi:2-keto-4-pentenoate hydratase